MEIIFVNVPTLNSNENFTEEVIVQVEEKISMPEEISEPSKISKPAQAEPFKFPEIVLPPQNDLLAPNYEPPRKYEPPQKNFSGLLKTEFYLNGVLFNQDEHKDDRETIARADWQRMQARLRITNDTGDVWQNPTIKFVFSPNWGGDPLTEIKSLPPLNADASADFIISFDAYELPDKENLFVCLQIYLEGDESKTDEHYWCVWFEVD